MKMITTKVKSVQGCGSFESVNGAEQPNGKKLMFSYDYEFEDGVFLQANHKSVPSPFPVGSEVEYEVKRESDKYGKSGRVIKPGMSVYENPTFGGAKYTAPTSDDNLKGIKIGHAITNAVQIALIELKQGAPIDTIENIIKGHARMILKIADELYNEDVKDIKTVSITVSPKATATKDINDLPF